MLSFWGLCCRPDVQQLQALYQRYHARGLEVVNVAVLTDAAQWRQAVQSTGMPGRHASDLQGYDGPAMRAFNLSGYPTTVLIDAEGKLLAEGLRGQQLAKQLAQLLP